MGRTIGVCWSCSFHFWCPQQQLGCFEVFPVRGQNLVTLANDSWTTVTLLCRAIVDQYIPLSMWLKPTVPGPSLLMKTAFPLVWVVYWFSVNHVWIRFGQRRNGLILLISRCKMSHWKFWVLSLWLGLISCSCYILFLLAWCLFTIRLWLGWTIAAIAAIGWSSATGKHA